LFGNSVALSGNTVVVGAQYDDAEATDSGQAYIFNATTGALIATLKNPTPAVFDQFGRFVSVSGNTVVVGAITDDTTAADSGQAYVFDATTGALIAILDNPTPARQDWFGYSVSVSGNTVVVGASGDDTVATDKGQVYVFDATTGDLIATLDNPSSTSSNDGFGHSVSVSGNTVVVGASGDDTGAANSGQAYVFNTTTGALIGTLANPFPADLDGFGSSVSVSGNTVVVGTRPEIVGAAGSGQAYVFDATTGALIATLDTPFPGSQIGLGVSASVSGNTVVVGIPRDDTQNTDQGAVYVF
jgi:hypothetical protein